MLRRKWVMFMGESLSEAIGFEGFGDSKDIQLLLLVGLKPKACSKLAASLSFFLKPS